jgi:hypothetical protein
LFFCHKHRDVCCTCCFTDDDILKITHQVEFSHDCTLYGSLLCNNGEMVHHVWGLKARFTLKQPVTSRSQKMCS